jgi:hypothetical protein
MIMIMNFEHRQKFYTNVCTYQQISAVLAMFDFIKRFEIKLIFGNVWYLCWNNIRSSVTGKSNQCERVITKFDLQIIWLNFKFFHNVCGSFFKFRLKQRAKIRCKNNLNVISLYKLQMSIFLTV